MRTLWAWVTIAAVAAVLAGGSAAAADTPEAERKPPRGSIARQLLLKHRLEKIANGTLVATLNHNRREWQALSPDQREQYRREVLAFLKESPEQQKRLVRHFEKVIQLSHEKRVAYRERAKWLKVVVDSFTPAEREKLQKMPPDERARILLDRKAELIRQGKLPSEEPAATAPSQPAVPAVRPTTRPAE